MVNKTTLINTQPTSVMNDISLQLKKHDVKLNYYYFAHNAHILCEALLERVYSLEKNMYL